MAVHVRLSLVAIDPDWWSHGELTKVEGVWECSSQLSFSLFLSILAWDFGLKAVYRRSWR